MFDCNECIHADVCAKLAVSGCTHFMSKDLVVPIPCSIGSHVFEAVKSQGKFERFAEFICVGFHEIDAPCKSGRKRDSYIIVKCKYTNSLKHIPYSWIGERVFLSEDEARLKVQNSSTIFADSQM